jgi:hypothetical protein
VLVIIRLWQYRAENIVGTNIRAENSGSATQARHTTHPKRAQTSVGSAGTRAARRPTARNWRDGGEGARLVGVVGPRGLPLSGRPIPEVRGATRTQVAGSSK